MTETDKNKELIEAFIEFFGSDKIMDNINLIDIADYCDDYILKCINDDDLISAISQYEKVLDILSDDIIIEYLEDKNYKVIDNLTEKLPIIEKLEIICRELQPNGYIDKEDAKKLICEYIDNWMTNSF